MDSLYVSKTIDLVTYGLLIVYTLVLIIETYLPTLKISSMIPYWLSTILSTIILFLVARIILRRDFYLPFLGETVFPCEPLQEKTPEGANQSIQVRTTPNSNIVYWASLQENDKVENIIAENPLIAYSKFQNSGVVRSDLKGNAVLKIKTPISYKVPSGKVLKPHVHYRVCGEQGMLGSIQTIYL